MARKPKTKRRRRKAAPPARPGWWATLDDQRRRRIVRSAGVCILAAVILPAAAVAIARLEMHVDRLLLAEHPAATLRFVDLPERLAILADDDLHEAVADLLAGRWTDDRLCREMAARLTAVGWVEKVNHVRRTSDARFEVSCRYRLPSAMLQRGGEFFLVDAAGVRLPGVYLYDPAWKLVQGVGTSPPVAGAMWAGKDLQAGLNVLEGLEAEPFSGQIAAVYVDNFTGRLDPRRSHIELETDREAGRIRWGSAPGFEVEENSVEQKLAILRENYRRTGRADAGHLVIDISTFPDRFSIPG